MTVLLYVLFRDALLKSLYNRIMLNFVISILLAFLTLAISRTQPPEPGNAVCVLDALLNQFFFLATFAWMTIMSYEIFKQLRGMSVIREKILTSMQGLCSY